MKGNHPMRRPIKALVAGAVAATAAACGASHGASPPTNTPPVVVLDGRDLNLGSGVVSTSGVCTDHASERPGWDKSAKKLVAWRGVTNGVQPDAVALIFFENGTKSMWTIDISSGGREYQASWKDTIITVDGPTNDGWYRFSGTVRPDTGNSTSDFDNPTLKVNGSIACANYGAPF